MSTCNWGKKEKKLNDSLDFKFSHPQIYKHIQHTHISAHLHWKLEFNGLLHAQPCVLLWKIVEFETFLL